MSTKDHASSPLPFLTLPTACPQKSMDPRERTSSKTPTQPLQHRRQQRRHHRTILEEGFLLLSLTQIIGFLTVAFLVGALIPLLVFKARGEQPSNHDNMMMMMEVATTTSIPASREPQRMVNHLRHENRTDTNGIKLAWLMSFPNSGTSYTMSLVASASNMSMATNYGWELVDSRRTANTSLVNVDNNNITNVTNITNMTTTNNTVSAVTNIVTPLVPVLTLPDSSRHGPFWLQPFANRPLSTGGVVLTKTHCGGYCHDCRPYKSVETPHSFLMHCAMAEAEYFNINENKVMNDHFIYDYNNVVDRAVHLFRDPMDNMVSRYHLGVHKVTKQNRTDLMARYTYDAVGYNNFCHDKTYVTQEHSEFHVDQDVLHLIEDVPCHLDLFRYIQWHDLAFIVTDDLLNIPTHIIHYEDYSSDFESTLHSLLDFLELPNTGAYTPFEAAGKSYHENYFTLDQISRLKTASMMLASPMTWHFMKRYFE